jgi:putative tryptophan/tyrosine transport system substrate-binding protein
MRQCELGQSLVDQVPLKPLPLKLCHPRFLDQIFAPLFDDANPLAKAFDLVVLVFDDSREQQATKEIPILGSAEDMVGSRFVASLAKPGGNTTGVSFLSSELDGKRQQILMETVPDAHRYAALADVNSSSPQRLKPLEEMTRARGTELSIYRVAKSEEIAGAVDAAKNSGAAALNVLASTLLYNNRQTIMPRTAALALPAIYQWPTAAAEGALIGYGPRLDRIYGDFVSRQLVKLLRGVAPADIPVEQPTKFDLVVNLKTAKALGLAIPPSLLARADEVIE